MKKIIFIHSLNNYTGSPNILANVIKGLIAKGEFEAELITSKGSGFLSNIEGLTYRYTSFKWCSSKILTLILMMWSQFLLFFRILFSSSKHIYYINTITPFGAILACRLSKKNFVIHVHENMQQNKAIYRLYRFIYKHCNVRSIFVSHYLYTTALNCHEGKVIYNGLSQHFCDSATSALESHQQVSNQKTIFVAASLRRFKGVYQFVELAKQLPHRKFELVLSASTDEVEAFSSEIGSVPNLRLFTEQKELSSFYIRAKVLMQLSLPELCVESFGLTILEAMVYGVPSIVPNAGGPTELIEDGVNGFTINPHDIDIIKSKIELLYNNSELYESMSEKALEISLKFSQQRMVDQIASYIHTFSTENMD